MELNRPLRRIPATLVGTLLVLTALSGTGCKKDEAATPGVVPVSGSDKIDLSATIIGEIPKDSLGFIQWDLTSTAYANLAKSPWGGNSSFFSNLELASQEENKFLDALKRAGIDPQKRETYEPILAQGVGFLAPAADVNEKLALGLLLQSKAGVNLGDKFGILKQELQNAGKKTEDISSGPVSGFRVDISDAPQAGQPAAAGATGKYLYLVWSKDRGVFSNSKTLASTVLVSTSRQNPALVDSADFKSMISQLPAVSSQFGLGYLGVADLLKHLEASGTPIPDAQLKNFPVKAIASAFSMGEAPQTDLKLLVKPEGAEQQKWFAVLNTSQSDKVLPAVPSNPFLFLSLDGETLKRAKANLGDLAKSGQPQADAVLAAVDQLQRVAIAASIAPVGQSMFPVPNVLIVAQASSPDQVQKALADATAFAVNSSGMMQAVWQEKDIDGVKVRAMNSPLGFGMYLASKGNLVIASSTEPQLKASLATIASGKGFESALAPRIQKTLAKDMALANLYLDFNELGSMMENLGGMLTMFAPQQGESAQKFLAPENIASIKKMGRFVGSLTVDKNVISITSYYQATPAQVASSN